MVGVHQPGQPGQENARLHPRASEADQCMGRMGAGETVPGHYQCLEKAEIVREGRDVTILCYSRMRYVVMQAVTQLEKSGYDPEVCS